MLIKKLYDDAVLPTRGRIGDAGMDLSLQEDAIIEPLSRCLLPTGIAMMIPPGYYGHICDRSGNANKLGLHVFGGIADENYQGQIMVILFNSTNVPRKLKKGDRIAQIIFKKYEIFDFELVKEFPEITARGDQGLGSSGV